MGLREHLDGHTLPEAGPTDEEIEQDIEEGMALDLQATCTEVEPV
jgi:hypothetical protein